jgi:hypothetical protein
MTVAALVALVAVAASLLPNARTDVLPAAVALGAWSIGLVFLPQPERFRSGGFAAGAAMLGLAVWFLQRQRRTITAPNSRS